MTRQGQFILAASGAYVGGDAPVPVLTQPKLTIYRDDWFFSFMFGVYVTVSLVSAQGAAPLTFVGCDKSKQKHACACSPKVLKITASVW